MNIRSKSNIIALGGGGFSTEDSPLLDDYILSVSSVNTPKICFIPTASGDSVDYVSKFYRRFSHLGCHATDLQLFNRGIHDLESFICSRDIVYVGGGNTANMLAIWRIHGLDAILKKALLSGVILAGISAGSLCWFECGITDSFGQPLQRLDSLLGFIKGSNCPHYDTEKQRRPIYHQEIALGMPDGYAADDGVALHFVDGSLYKVVSSRQNAKGYSLVTRSGNVEETILETTFLG